MGSTVHVYPLSPAEAAGGITAALLKAVEARGGGWALDKVHLYADDMADLDEDGEMLLPNFLFSGDPDKTIDHAGMNLADAEDVEDMLEEIDMLDPDALAEVQGASDEVEEWTAVIADLRTMLASARDAGQGLLAVLR